jgi:hypothetical protein
MADPSRFDFGRRRPSPLPDAQQPKRSSHVALLVMGTLVVGGGAYAMMEGENCRPVPPAVASQAVTSPAVPPTGTVPPATTCSSHESSGYSHWYHSYSRSSSFGDSPSSSSSSSEHVSRGGFGSFAHAVGFSGSS